MSRSIPRRSAALFLTAGLASLAVATQSAQAADLVGKSGFDLAKTSFGALNLGVGSASKSYSTNWNQTSSNLGIGINCKLLCTGYDLTLNTTGSLGATVVASATAGTAILNFNQLTTTTLHDTGVSGQYKFSTSAVTLVSPTFTTSGAAAFVQVGGSLNYKDSLHAKACALGDCATKDQTLLSFGSNNFPIVSMITLGGGSVSVAGQSISLAGAAAGTTIPVTHGGKALGTVTLGSAFGSALGLSSSNGAAGRTDKLLTESLNVLELATSGSASVLQGSVNIGKIAGVNIGTVAYNAGSATLNAIESLVQSSTMVVTSAIDTVFRNKKGADISLLVKPTDLKKCAIGCLTPTPSGFYSVHDISQLNGVARNAESNGFLIGDGSVDLGGDQIVTATTYNVSFQEVLGFNLSGTIDLAALSGKAFGTGFGPLFSTEIKLGGQSWTVYSHTFMQTFTSFNTVSIPETVLTSLALPFSPDLPGVPEPATWALMLVGFGAIGLTLRRRPYGPIVA